MTLPTAPGSTPDPLEDTLLYDHDTETDTYLNTLLQMTESGDAQIEIVKVDEAAGWLVRTLFGLDAHDDTPVEIYRFPGAPDAYAGTTRGMQSYDSWLYFGYPGEGKRIVFIHGIENHARERYRKILSTTLGRPVEFKE